MKYIAPERITEAIVRLKNCGFHLRPSAVLTFLFMKKSGVNTSQPTVFGMQQEGELLSQHFSPPGGTRDHPFYNPFGGEWVKSDYSGKTLQRARNDSGSDPESPLLGNALHHPKRSRTWMFVPNYLPVVELLFKKSSKGNGRIPLKDFAVWFYREREWDEASTEDDILHTFRDDFHLSPEELSRLFDTTGSSITFSSVEIGEADYKSVISPYESKDKTTPGTNVGIELDSVHEQDRDYETPDVGEAEAQNMETDFHLINWEGTEPVPVDQWPGYQEHLLLRKGDLVCFRPAECSPDAELNVLEVTSVLPTVANLKPVGKVVSSQLQALWEEDHAN